MHVAADAQIDRQIQERVMMPAKQLGAAVGRAVVHDEKIHLRAFRAQIFYRIDDVILLIVARDDNKNFFIQRGVPLNRIVVTSLGPLCEGDSPLRGEMSRSDRGARARRAPPAGGGGENLAVIRNISGRGKVLSLRPCGATSLPEGGREKTAERFAKGNVGADSISARGTCRCCTRLRASNARPCNAVPLKRL